MTISGFYTVDLSNSDRRAFGKETEPNIAEETMFLHCKVNLNKRVGEGAGGVGVGDV